MGESHIKETLADLREKFQNGSIQEILEYFLRVYEGRITLASSLGLEDQVLTDLVLKINPGTGIFVLDTGRLPQETYELMEETMKKYHMNYDVYFPEWSAVEQMTRQFGPNLFYKSSELRQKCCQIRKVEPFRRALKDLKVWITGLRREQDRNRARTETIEWDETNELIKVNPLTAWSLEQVWQYIREHRVPYNKLHDQDYPSIGCSPCTRAVRPGEELRAGRWWWEDQEKKECGLHVYK